MVSETEQRAVGVAAKTAPDRRPKRAIWAFALGLALAIAAATLWAMSLVGHDDGKDVAVLVILAAASFLAGGHAMDRFESDGGN